MVKKEFYMKKALVLLLALLLGGCAGRTVSVQMIGFTPRVTEAVMPVLNRAAEARCPNGIAAQQRDVEERPVWSANPATHHAVQRQEVYASSVTQCR